MQTFIDFLVNNYTWFIIIALILIFALIGYLVDTSEKSAKNNPETGEELANSRKSQIKQEDVGVLNMNTGLDENEELAKDVIVMPKKIETPAVTPEQILNPSVPNEEKTEVLEV